MRRRAIIGALGVGMWWPHVASAQTQSALPVIGFLNGRSPDQAAAVVAAFREGLGQSGSYEGRNVLINFRWAEGDYQRLPALARVLVERNVAVIAATGGYVSALAAKQATTSIPIVFTSGGDALRLGLVNTLNRPEANVTGINLFFGALGSKQIELLRLMVPKADNIAMLVNPANPTTDSDVAEVKQCARAIGVNLHIASASSPDGS